MFVPPALAEYRATLGHKANHADNPNAEYRYHSTVHSTVYSTVLHCSLYSAHPVLGTVMAVWALEDLEPGTEVTTHYGYTDPGLYGDMGIQTEETEESCSANI